VTDAKQTPQQDGEGRFITGNIGGPGRPKGSRNKLGEDFLKVLATDFEQHGQAVIEKVRETKPEIYLRVIADLLPKDVKVNGRVGLGGDGLSKEHRDAIVAAALRAHV
jgi:hypothetical protein